MLGSCSASYHLKRAIAKDPEILADTIVRVDTTIVTDAITLRDTLIVRDTIAREIVREGVQIKIKRIHDTIQIKVECPADTIRVVAEVPVDRIIYKEQPAKRSFWDQINRLLVLILLIAGVIFLGRIFTR